ncbi:MAG: hypothetical protein LBT14_13050 [Treponema sp.]|jgi:hypothetical protein|nr:hypothetical protein [Treponema sp.]
MPNTEQKNGNRDFAAENRQAIRYSSVAGVCIHGFEGEALLSDMSSRGFRMESRTYVSLTPGECYTMKITPESDMGTGSFEIEVEVRWVHSTTSLFTAGFSIAKPPTDYSFQRYIDYLSVNNRR